MGGRWRLYVLVWLPLLIATKMYSFTQESSSDYFVTAAVEPSQPYVGQQILYRFKMYTAVNLPESPLYFPPDFHDVWQTRQTFNQFSTEVIDGRSYNITEVDTILYTIEQGDIMIAPAVAQFPGTGVERLQTDSVTVRVRPLPAGAPADFNGAVGQFDLQVTLDRNVVNARETFVISMTVTGTGNLEQTATPNLNLPDSWRIDTQPAQFRMELRDNALFSRKTFQWWVIPDTTGQFELTDITWSYFDPQMERYQTLTAPETTLVVRSSVSPNAIPAIKSVLIPMINLPPFPGVLAALPPTIVLTLFMVQRVRRPASNPSAQFERRLNAISQREIRKAYQEVDLLLREMLSEKLGESVHVLEIQEIGNRLEKRGLLEADERKKLTNCLLQTQERFNSDKPLSKSNLQQLMRNAKTAIRTINKVPK